MKILFKVLCIILAVMALPMMLLQPVIGAIMLIFAVLGIWKGNKMFEKKKEPAQAEVQPEPIHDKPLEKKETIKAVGISKYQDAVKDLGRENEEYKYSKKEIIDSGLEDEEIPEYNFHTLPATFVYEPDNEYDSNAIAIYVLGNKIGYVETALIPRIHDLIEYDLIKSASCEIVGGRFKKYDSDTETIEKKSLTYGARITITLKDE